MCIVWYSVNAVDAADAVYAAENVVKSVPKDKGKKFFIRITDGALSEQKAASESLVFFVCRHRELIEVFLQH